MMKSSASIRWRFIQGRHLAVAEQNDNLSAVTQERRRREVVQRALANENLMEQVLDSIAAIERGEKGIPGKEVWAKARRLG